MAFDTYMQFQDATENWLKGESQVQITGTESSLGADLKTGHVFEIDDFSFDIEQAINIGSQSSGIGAGKVTFNPFSITRKTDRISPLLFHNCCAGMHFQEVSLYLRKAGAATTSGTAMSGTTFMRFDFKLVGVKTINWSGSDGDESCKEEVTFEYGALQIRYLQQDTKGQFINKDDAKPHAAWNRIYNNDKFDSVAAT
ncbi:MAG: Hcp family type VI secretion system effector [Acetobacteraceae bacterium]